MFADAVPAREHRRFLGDRAPSARRADAVRPRNGNRALDVLESARSLGIRITDARIAEHWLVRDDLGTMLHRHDAAFIDTVSSRSVDELLSKSDGVMEHAKRAAGP